MVLLYFIGLNIADALLTSVAIVLGAIETNPILNLFSFELGLPTAMLVKAVFALALGSILWERRKVRVLVVLNYVMVGIVVNNAIIITYTL